MKAIAAALICIGIIGLILCSILPAFFTFGGIIGSVVAIIVGIGFLVYTRCWCRRDCC